MFLVSHNNKSIRDTCDRVLWLEKRRAADGRPDPRTVLKEYNAV